MKTKTHLYLSIDSAVKKAALAKYRGELSQKVEHYLSSLVFNDLDNEEGVHTTIDDIEQKTLELTQKVTEMRSQILDLKATKELIVKKEKEARRTLQGAMARHLQDQDAANPESI